MQRYSKKDSFYFSHDSNARNDIKLLSIRRDHGPAGYGIYFMLIEILRDQQDYRLPLSAIADIAFDLHITEETICTIINNYGLFEKDEKCFFSIRLCRSMEEFNARRIKFREAGKKGNDKRWGTNGMARQSPPDRHPIALKEKEKESKSKSKGELIKEYAFDAPEFIEVFNEWIQYRQEIKKPLTAISIKNQTGNLKIETQENAIAILRQSMSNGWVGLQPLKIQNNGKSNNGETREQAIRNFVGATS